MGVTGTAHAACHRPEPDVSLSCRPRQTATTWSPTWSISTGPTPTPTHPCPPLCHTVALRTGPRSATRLPPRPWSTHPSFPTRASSTWLVCAPLSLQDTQATQTHSRGQGQVRESEAASSAPSEQHCGMRPAVPGQDLPAQGCSGSLV